MSMQTLRRAAGYAALAKDAVKLRGASEDMVRQRAEQHLSQRMGRLRGLPQKLGQMLSFSADQSDQEADANSFAELQDSAEPLPWETIEEVLADAWQCDPASILSEVEPIGHAASLGQVHKARLKSGEEVAIKVQYPGIRQAVQTDLKALGWLSMPVGNLRRGFDVDAYRQVIAGDLEQELDYHSELQRQEALGLQWIGNSSVVIPRVWHDLCRDNVLVSDWEDGEHWSEVQQNWMPQKRRQLANVLLTFFLEGLFKHGVMQADWHPGNVRFRDNGSDVQLVLYDFGCMTQPSTHQRLVLARLIQATIDGSESPYPLLLELGFNKDYLEPLEAKLPALCKVLFEPYCMLRPYDAADWNLGERVGAILGDDRWNFRIAGPPELLFLMRAFHGLCYYIQGLGAAVHWNAQFRSISAALQDEYRALKVAPIESSSGFECVSKHMRIRVVEGDVTKVQLSQCATNIERIHELLDDDLKRRIRLASIDLDQILAEVRQRGYAPGPVFRLEEGQKRVEVWLE